MDKAEALKKLELIENLPTLPVIVTQIQKLIDNPKSNMSQIATVITRDQAIAARVVRLINSAFYGIGTKISSIQQAIMLLGLNTVKNLVIGVSVVKTFEGAHGSTMFDRQKFWLHSFGCAIGSRQMAKLLKVDEPEDFFMAGLLHDIGILILDQFFHGEFIGMLQKASATNAEFILVEAGVLGLTHCEVGNFMTEKWRIPEIFKIATFHHHQPKFFEIGTEYNRLIAAVVHIADAMACRKGISPGFQCTTVLDEVALQKAGIKNNAVEDIFDGVQNEVKKVMADWGIH
jgi:HD-like signal output (HDOD) protein